MLLSKAESYPSVWTDRIVFMHSSVCAHGGGFRVSVIVNHAAVDTVVQVPESLLSILSSVDRKQDCLIR